ncbi:hypothetical protein [Franzmannia qiaohouensis]|uniref:Uncharacterized protein n=1 Tax=Franzmannia qiaohouensis TaxID=1329370 RepID=A0ABU1HDX6_9GAMM|nr:hypothetical protein [Halomonas qiaohouensis]MDR5905679.1 hypothetical protein [Halomonas qiaohouensis]
MKGAGKFISVLLFVFILVGCSKEEREASSLYEALLEDIAEIDALSSDASISDKLTAYSKARHKIETIRTRYADTKKGDELQGNAVLASSQSVEDILLKADAVEDEASELLSENQAEFIVVSTIPIPEVRNSRLESHGISLARQGDIEEAKAVVPHLINSLSMGIVQLEIAKAYQQNGDLEEAMRLSLRANDTISQYDFDEDICSTENCDNEETRKRLVETELRMVRTDLYSS